MSQCKKSNNGGDIDSPEFQDLLDKLSLLQRLMEAYPQAWYSTYTTREEQRANDRFEKFQITNKGIKDDFGKHTRMFLQAVEENYQATQIISANRVMDKFQESIDNHNAKVLDADDSISFENVTPFLKK